MGFPIFFFFSCGFAELEQTPVHRKMHSEGRRQDLDP